MPSTFLAKALFKSIDFFSFPFLIFGPFFLHCFLAKNCNLFSSSCWALFFLVAPTISSHIGVPSCWLTETAEILQRAVAEAAVLQPWWVLLFPAALAEILPGHTLTLTQPFFPVDISLSRLHFLISVLRFAFHVHWDRLYRDHSQCAHLDRMCGCVLAHHNRYRVVTVAVDGVCNWIPWVHLEVGDSLLCVVVDCQLGLRMPWHSSSLHIWAHLLWSSRRSRPQRHSSYCQLHVDCILGFIYGNFLRGLCRCRNLFACDCQNVYHYRHLW